MVIGNKIQIVNGYDYVSVSGARSYFVSNILIHKIDKTRLERRLEVQLLSGRVRAGAFRPQPNIIADSPSQAVAPGQYASLELGLSQACTNM